MTSKVLPFAATEPDEPEIPLDEPEIPAEEPEIPAEDPTGDPPLIPEDAKCEEASPLSRGTYIPCGAKAVAIVEHRGEKRYFMCLGCANHNVRNRGGKLIAGTDGVTSIPPANSQEEVPAETTPAVVNALVPTVMQVLPADFPLPTLIHFVPNPLLRQRADEAAAYALSLTVHGPEGLQTADLASTALRTSLKAIEDHFAEPADIANQLHKSITSTRSDWLSRGQAALKQISGRIATEQLRLKREADEVRRKAQEEADRKAREERRREAELAAKQHAPKAVVEELQKQAEMVTAPPVTVPVAAPVLTGNAVVTTWKGRPTGTPGSDDPNPSTDALTPAQKVEFLKTVKAILDGRAPIQTLSYNWTYINKRAKADKSTLAIPGIEAYEEVGTRAKATRAR